MKKWQASLARKRPFYLDSISGADHRRSSSIGTVLTPQFLPFHDLSGFVEIRIRACKEAPPRKTGVYVVSMASNKLK